jgi:hypothetical protein
VPSPSRVFWRGSTHSRYPAVPARFLLSHRVMHAATLMLVLATATLSIGVVGRNRPELRAASPGPATGAPGFAVSAQAPPDPPTGLAVLAQSGTTVTLGWSAPASGPSPTGYVLEGGFSPGEVLGSLPIDGDARTLTLDAPTGTFHIRLHASAGGERSAWSTARR